MRKYDYSQIKEIRNGEVICLSTKETELFCGKGPLDNNSNCRCTLLLEQFLNVQNIDEVH